MMDIARSLKTAWAGRNPYPGLSILEATIVWHESYSDEWIPARMQSDFLSVFGQETVQREQDTLKTAGALLCSKNGIKLNGDFVRPLSALINQMRAAMLLPFADGTLSAEDFLTELTEYLVGEAEAVQEDAPGAGRRCLVWKDERYDLRLGLSPVWLPALADKAAENQQFVAVFCPFTAFPWEKMIGYYDYPAFRNHTAYFDPWHCGKMNISKGGLFAYFDWYFRDIHQSRFLIPAEFLQALFDKGLVRYNDER